MLALGIGGLTVRLAGDLFDASGGFHALYLMLAGAAVIGAAGAALLPRAGAPRASLSEA